MDLFTGRYEDVTQRITQYLDECDLFNLLMASNSHYKGDRLYKLYLQRYFGLTVNELVEIGIDPFTCFKNRTALRRFFDVFEVYFSDIKRNQDDILFVTIEYRTYKFDQCRYLVEDECASLLEEKETDEHAARIQPRDFTINRFIGLVFKTLLKATSTKQNAPKDDDDHVKKTELMIGIMFKEKRFEEVDWLHSTFQKCISSFYSDLPTTAPFVFFNNRLITPTLKFNAPTVMCKTYYSSSDHRKLPYDSFRYHIEDDLTAQFTAIGDPPRNSNNFLVKCYTTSRWSGQTLVITTEIVCDVCRSVGWAIEYLKKKD